MPRLLVLTLRWGGIFLTVVFGALLIRSQMPQGAAAGAGVVPSTSRALELLYLALFLLGLGGVAVGFGSSDRNT
jgi:hypothetical protein